MSDDCIFCKIRDGEVPGEVLYRDDYCLVIRDIAPQAPAHLLVIPLQHFTYLTELTQDFYPTLGAMFSAARETAETQGISAGGYRLVINQGENAGQVVPHLHLHLLGGKPLERMG